MREKVIKDIRTLIIFIGGGCSVSFLVVRPDVTMPWIARLVGVQDTTAFRIILGFGVALFWVLLTYGASSICKWLLARD